MDPTILSAWPHAEGMVRLSYSPSGQYLYTGGSESYIRVFETDANNDDGEAGNNPKLIEFHTEGINCLDSSVRPTYRPHFIAMSSLNNLFSTSSTVLTRNEGRILDNRVTTCARRKMMGRSRFMRTRRMRWLVSLREVVYLREAPGSIPRARD